jgi:hypothetical protein
MRNFLAVILAVIAGLSAVFGVVSWRLSDLIHDPEPVQEILSTGEAAEEVKQALPETLGNMTVGATGVDAVDEVINRAVREASGQIISLEGFDAAWSDSLEQTRTGWIENIDGLRAQLNAGESIPENSTAAQLDLRLEPIVALVVSTIDDALARVPGINVSVDMETDIAATVPTSIPPISVLTAEQVVMAEELVTLWPAILALAGLVFVMALVIAARGSRWIVWLMTGLMAAIGGAAVKVGYTLLQNQLLERVEDASALTLLRPLLRAVQDWSDPQLIVLMVAGVGVTLLGILGGFISSHRRR